MRAAHPEERRDSSCGNDGQSREPTQAIPSDRFLTGHANCLRPRTMRMKAIRVTEHGGPEVLKLEEFPQPSAGQGQVLVKIAAAGVNPVDTYIRSGNYSISNLPYTPGMDGAGTVEEVGHGVSGLRIRQRVYLSGSLSGTYAEFALCDSSTVHPLPDNISFEQGAGVNIPYATAYRALFHRAQARAGETVLIHGASGGVGIAAVQWAAAMGLNVIGTAGSDEGRKLVLAQGALHVLNHRQAGYAEELLRLTNGKGVDVILEMLANVNLGNDLTLLAKYGRVVVIGSRGKVELNPRDAMSRDATILGMTLFNATGAELSSIHAALFAGLKNQTLRPIVGKEFPLAQAASAHTAVMEPGAYGKIVLKVAP
jgi:NADPH2:quinone reductase